MKHSKVILITGASSGFGLLIADKLHHKEHKVYGTSRNPSKMQVPFQTIALDMNDTVSIKNCVEAVIKKEGRIDVLVNNAGVYNNGFFEEETDEVTRIMFETLFFGVAEMMRQVLPYMRQQRSGHLINVTSIAGLLPSPGAATYSAAKHAVEGLTKSVDYELRQFGIKTSLIEPGNFKTGIAKTANIAEAIIEDYDNARTKLMNRLNELVIKDGMNPQILADGLIKVIENKRPKIRNIIGNFAKIIPFTLLFPKMLDSSLKKEFPFLFERMPVKK